MLVDAAFETDAEGRFIAFGGGDVLGHPAGQLLGTQSAALFEGPPGAFEQIFAAICTDRAAWHGSVLITRADGRLSFYRLALAPKLDERGAVVAVYGLLQDVAAPEHNLPPRNAAEFAGARAAKILDSETGIWSAPSFIEQASRRFDRLDVEDKPGTLLFLGFRRTASNLHTPVAMRMIEELREIIRPTDLLGRIDQTTIALWCDGMDHLTGAERAARFCKQMPNILPGAAIVSVGLVTRWPNSGDDPDAMIGRAGLALRDADIVTERDSKGSWRVWQQMPAR
jgi:GGDEF domain-containing protein